jgi:hypothetical protein
MLRPEVAEVHELLRQHTGLIVHFSGCPPMHVNDWGKEHFYPKDLRRVIAGNASSGISCSAVCAGDVFEGENGASIGYIGVIVTMKSKDSLIIASKGDDGTRIDEYGNRIAINDRDLTVDDLEATLKLGSGHNEWAIRDFCAKGILAVSPYCVWHHYEEIAAVCETAPEFDDAEFLQEGNWGPRPVKLRELRQDFPNIGIYTFENGGIVRLDGSQRIPVIHEELYPIPE